MCMFQILRKYHYKTLSLIITQWRVGESRHPLSDSNCCSEPVSYAAVEEDGTSGLVIEVFDDMDKVCADVVLLHGYPQSCIQNPFEGLLEVYEDMVEILLVLETFLT